MPIDLPPSDNTESLSEAIEQATTTGEQLRLLPGTHFTKPGVLIHTPIGPKGLTVAGPGPIAALKPNVARIQRPDHSIGTDPLKRTDGNYGIFFIPSPPTKEEVAGIKWLTHRPETGAPFQYGIIIRGDIKIGGITLDCNMGNQGLEKLPKAQVEHSAMLGFSGFTYTPDGKTDVKPDGPHVFVGFNSVTLSGILLARGGFADDLWFPPGYFRPNIERVELDSIVSAETPSEKRVNQRRASVGFSGLAQAVLMKECRIDSLHLEFDEDWSTFPGPATKDPHFHESTWLLNSITAAKMSFGPKGAVQTIQADNLDVTETFEASRAAGSISNSRLAVSSGQDRRIFGLRNFQFKNCVWNIGQAEGVVRGLALTSAAKHMFSASFQANTFATAAGFKSGQLIDTGDRSPDRANYVIATFHQCKYQAGFATPQFPDTHIAKLREQGDYTFLKADFNGLSLAQAVDAKNAQQTDKGASVLYHIPFP